MRDDMRFEAMAIAKNCIEKNIENFELAAREAKEALDQKFGPPFHVVIGETYGMSITYQTNSMLLMFCNNNLAVLIWRTVLSFG